jgi:exodeoxyribonuclease VII small subunit
MMTYEKAFEEIKKIAKDIEEGNIPIDKLEVSIKRSKELIQFCQDKLRSIEKELESV